MEPRILDARFERSDRATIRALQFEKLRALLDKAWATNDFYRGHWSAAGAAPDRVASLEDFTARIPPVRKADFIADQERDPPYGRRTAHARGQREPLTVFTTSGTTGQGVEVHVETEAERVATFQVSDYLYRWAGLERGDAIFLNFPVTLLGGGRIELLGLEHYGLTVFPVGNYDVRRKLELLDRFRPQAIQSTTSYLGHLAAVSDKRPPCASLKVLFGGGEGGGFSWFERLQEDWQVPVFNQYGATQTRVDNMYPCERGIGSRDRPGLLHNIDPYFLLEVIDPKSGRQVADGEAGEIVLTSLVHTEVPLIRCAMGDLAVYHDPTYCTCGRPFAGVEIGTIGRMDDMVKVKGINVWPQAVDDVIFETPEIDEYQIVISSSADAADVITARVMPTAEMGGETAAAFAASLGERLRGRIGIRFRVELVPPGSLERSEYKARRWRDTRGRRPCGPAGDSRG
ncbi:MAG TPA: AMP-binding protein [Kiloniellales bacterium]